MISMRCRMKRNTIAVVFFALIFILAGCAHGIKNTNISSEADIQLTQEEKLEDFEYMYMILEENYPYFEVNKKQNDINWLSKKAEYIAIIKSADDDKQFFYALDDVLDELNNCHTNMLDKNFYSYCKSIYEKVPEYRAPWLNILTDPKAVKRYESMTSTENDHPFSANAVVPDNVKTCILEDNKTAYMSVSSFNSFNIKSDIKIIGDFFRSVKDYEKLIIDIRGNGGGDSGYWSKYMVPMLINEPVNDTRYFVYRGGSYSERFIECIKGCGYKKLKKISDIDKENLPNLPPNLKQNFKYYSKSVKYYKPKYSVGFKGEIYLLIDEDVYSSADAFAVFAKDTGFATLVGKTTQGDGIGFDPILCLLPNSGYIFRFPDQMGLTADGTCNCEYKTVPDIEVEADRSEKIFDDEAVKAVLNLK